MKPFEFKQFSVKQDKCAMKIGTDGVLLGAWTSLDHDPYNILDVGAGTGVIALQLAQRSIAENIEAIEIDEDAYEQCVENFENSPWSDRLFCYHAGFDELVAEPEEQYDLIVSNPPFYSEQLQNNTLENTPSEARIQARFTEALPFNDLLEGVSILLHEEGRFSTIIPHKEETTFISLAQQYNLFPKRICRVQGTPTSDIKRSLIEFVFKETECITSSLIIEEGRHQYTKAYMELTKDFYLKM